jgi:hypothetical protein
MLRVALDSGLAGEEPVEEVGTPGYGRTACSSTDSYG